LPEVSWKDMFFGRLLSVGNIRYGVDYSNICLIGPEEIRRSKYFIVTNNVYLWATPECNGMEIIIYNNALVNITVSGIRFCYVIFPKIAQKLVFLEPILQWVVIH
jgi:hypothetical protein